MTRTYTVYLAPERPTDAPEIVGQYTSFRVAERVARRCVAGARGSIGGCVPACADQEKAIDGYADRDGGEEASCSWIEAVQS